MLDTLDFHVQNGTRILLLENAEGFGKTTTLAQYAARHRERSVALFLRPQDSLLCHPDALRSDFFRQVVRLLDDNEPGDQFQVDDGLIRSALLKLNRKARKSASPVLFIVDGLEELPGDHLVRSAVVPLLHLDTRDFAFILSTLPAQLPLRLPKDANEHRLSLQVMGKDDVRTIFRSFGPTEAQVDTIRRVSQGIPVKVGSVRRLLDINPSLDEVLSEVPQGEANFFESEWRELARRGQVEDFRLLALIGVDLRSRTVDDLARLLGKDPDEIAARVERMPFLFVEGEDKTVRFEADAFRRFALGKVASYTADAYELLIRELSQDEGSTLSLRLLPELLTRSHNHERLLSVLSPENFRKMIGVAESLALVRHRAHLGVTSAERLQREPELLRLGLQESAIAAIERETASRAAVEALIAVGETQEALVLAQRSPTVEDRLQLMAIVATAQRRTGSGPDPALEAEITRQAQEIDTGILGRRAVDIAADIIAFSPSLALELVERASQESGSHGDMDWALARLSLAWTFSNQQRNDNDRIDESLRARIADPAARRFTARVASAVAGSSADRVISEAERFAEPEEKLYFMRNWLAHSGKRADAVRVTEATLALAVDTASFSVTADFLRDVASPLANADDVTAIKRCVAIVDNLKGTVAARSRRLHLFELEMALAVAEAAGGGDAYQDRCLSVYNDALTVNDPIDRCEALALILGTMALLGGRARELEDAYGIVALAEEQLRRDMAVLLEASADHYRATRDVVRYLARGYKHLAEEVGGQLNTLERREALLRDLALYELDGDAATVEWEWLIQTAKSISRGYLRDVVVADACDVVRRDRQLRLKPAAYAELWALAENVGDAALRFLSMCSLYAAGIGSEEQGVKSVALHNQQGIERALADIDSKSEQIDSGYTAVASIASTDPEFARRILTSVERTQGASPLTGMIPAFAYRDIVGLVIRALGGILAQDLDSEGPERALETLIQRVPSSADQVSLWSHVAMQYVRHRRSDAATALVRRFIRPLLEAIPQADREAYRLAMLEALPVLFVANKSRTLERVGEAPADERSDYVQVLCNYLLFGITVDEPYEAVHGRAAETDEDAILDVCDVLALCENDVIVWDTCGAVANAVASGRTKTPLTSQRRADIARRLREVVAAKLPHPHGVQHDGPAIVAEAQIARIDMARGDVWSDLVARARGIVNHADRCLVLYTIAGILPNKERIRRTRLVEEASVAADSMPASLDKIERLVDLAEAVAHRDAAVAKRALKRACDVARGVESDRGGQRAGRILDVAYRIDEDLAHALAKELDTDEARKAVRKRSQERLRVLEIKKRIGTGYYREGKAKEALSTREYVQAAQMALAALNAGLKRPAGLAALREGGRIAASLPLDRAGPLYAWIVENVARVRDRSPEMRSAVTAMFQSLLTAADLTFQLVDRASEERRAVVEAVDRSAPGGVLAGPAERDRVFEFIRKWGEAQSARTVTICDPYFGPTDLDVVEVMSWAMPEASFRILTSQAHQDREGVEYPYKESYRRAWSAVTDRDAPFVDVILVGEVRTGQSPIHDRWILAGEAGLTLGTSANSIGRTKLSQILELRADEVPGVSRRIEPLLTRSVRVYEGHRIEFDSFSL